MISILNITKKFDNFTAVDNLSMNVKKGEVLGVSGINTPHIMTAEEMKKSIKSADIFLFYGPISL